MDMWTIPAEGGEMTRLETPVGPKHSAAFSPDGQWIAFHCREGKGTPWKQTNLWLLPADGSEAARNLTAVYDIELGSGTLTDTGDRSRAASHLVARWLTPHFQVTKHGRTQLCSIRPDGERPARGN
jgi:Tol biopolymer transport system component